MQQQPPRVSPVGQLLQGGAIDPASSCRQHSMFLCYKSVVAQNLLMHCYAVFMINSGHSQYYSTVLNHSKMNLSRNTNNMQLCNRIYYSKAPDDERCAARNM